ncbi:bifunctional phosphoribosyl-AMP cyclohydrolase/phosphoribosyl-ATP diphosphatase HisIE [Enterococcus asini]|uniref:Histidine biosynthesis bifunctional protein HisIE n=1 Tax=Enterococcus asini TaxID=57732 RepID=A0AAW8U2K1_9ENTE|nr:bifunctional phosphoribosyl-AMP cyclohydrolase/phosphoribosyl-ATP diphosphatase HisIE [Enterococcus asini]MCD5029668.1 bifunctional phosphoribosyl-AMP cyclohydrolase/phosphoribosyl-ATP diphosphatase HisIE [Enterococcus asini]MDT2744789.1 bifunctional phosphoribosyl-AMP cyclohydrolase/phosphoribosyl-ATP diphosphatase HisIE [Enterococcus asini]MDT2764743.1 bifunctional phosphoribosyl-AMP cyclohydrolase/phosphoribosyl-ATP diphosphatase HisIE [Enterococcus asini]MDT2785278.1 bifunctional phospho
MIELEALKFDKEGLIPCVVQDFYTNQVLTVAYMNQESVAETLKTKQMTFYSRSRQELWRKGETSGNTQELVELVADCDQDALVAKVIKAGPACHTGSESCFTAPLYQDEEKKAFSVADLYQLVLDRKVNPQEKSYTSYLFAKGNEKILKKIGEESTEVVIGAMKESKEETTYEIADLIYHLLVLMANNEIVPAEILEELSKRQVVDKKVKQETLQ